VHHDDHTPIRLLPRNLRIQILLHGIRRQLAWWHNNFDCP